MIVQITPAAAADATAHRWLDTILRKVEDGWHIWEVTGLETFSDSSWVADRGSAGTWVQELFVAAVRRSAWGSNAPHHRRLRVVQTRIQHDELTPEKAARLAEEPFVVLVENRFSDRAFLTRVVRELDHRLARLLNNVTEPIRFDSLGGKGQMARYVEERCVRSSPVPRLAVVVDSDRATPTAPPSKEARKLLATCSRRGVPCWLLEKREAENYLPYALLNARRNVGEAHRACLAAWDRLPDDLKDVYDMPGRQRAAARDTFARGDPDVIPPSSGADRCTRHLAQVPGRAASAASARRQGAAAPPPRPTT